MPIAETRTPGQEADHHGTSRRSAVFVIAALSTPAGISGAVLLLPFQLSGLGTPSPSVTRPNLLYNVVSTAGPLYRYWRQVTAAAAWPWCSSPGPCPAWSPDR
jgi:hypothetical protein